MPEASHVDYGAYQGFTLDPTTGIVYGISSLGDVVRWPTLHDWLANTNAIVPGVGEPGYDAYGETGAQGSVHGASHDPATGGFYVVYEGDATIDGDVGAFQVTTSRGLTVSARAVVLATGLRGSPRKLGVPGEDTQKVTYRLIDPEQYHGKRVLVVGGGHSAINVALALMELRNGAPGTEIFWALRRANVDRLLGGGLNDQLPERGALGLAARQAMEDGRLNMLAPFAAEGIEEADGGLGGRDIFQSRSVLGFTNHEGPRGVAACGAGAKENVWKASGGRKPPVQGCA